MNNRLQKLVEALSAGDSDSANTYLSTYLRRKAVSLVNEYGYSREDLDDDPPDRSEKYTNENVKIARTIDGFAVELILDIEQNVVWDYVPATFNHADESEISDYGPVTNIKSKTFKINNNTIFEGDELFEDCIPFDRKLNEAVESVRYSIGWAIHNDDVPLNLDENAVLELSKKIVLDVKDVVDDIESGRYS